MIIGNEILEIELIELSQENTRFDHLGVIKQVRFVKDNYKFLTKEKRKHDKQINLGIGICNEFGPSRPIGFSAAQQNEWFLKPGVGKIQKKTDIYNSQDEYPFLVENVTKSLFEKGVTYTAKSKNQKDYSYMREKSITLSKNELIITQQLSNTGKLEFEIEEYFHNFLDFQKPEIYLGDFELNDEMMGIEKWSYNCEQKLHFAIWKSVPNSFSYSILDKETKHSFIESGDFSPFKFKIWIQDYCICPECFIKINLKPGESTQWKRIFRFT